MKILRALAAMALIGVAGSWNPAVARADCAGPTFEYSPTEVAPGGTVTITGTGFGDNCHDTGPPPAGEGTLGEPLSGIEIRLGQGDVSQVVATGSADEDYEFSVDVIVPPSFAPGATSVTVSTGTSASAYAGTSEPLVVSDAPPVESLGAEVAMFGPLVESGLSSGPVPEGSDVLEESPTPPISVEGDDDGSSPWVVIGAVLIVVLLAAGGWFAIRRR